MYDLGFSSEITSAYRQDCNEDTSRSKQFQRLLLGYYGLPFTLTPFRSGLSSKRANRTQSKTTNDHIIGVTLTGQYVKNELDNRVNDNYKDLKVHFIGSMSYIFKSQLAFSAKKLNVNIGMIIKQPINELVRYHIENPTKKARA